MFCADSLQRAVQSNDAQCLQAVCKLVDFQKLKSTAGPNEDSEVFQASVDEDSLNGISNLITELQNLLSAKSQ